MNERSRLQGAPPHPVVETILASIRTDPDGGGRGHIVHYARLVSDLLRLDSEANEELFVQITRLAVSYADEGATDVAGSLATLGGIGLESAGGPR